jgi:hypothetical protein
VSAVTTVQSFGRYIVQANGTATRIELERLHEVISARPKVRQLVLRFTEAMMALVLQNVACNAVHRTVSRSGWRFLYRDDWTHQFLRLPRPGNDGLWHRVDLRRTSALGLRGEPHVTSVEGSD